MQDSLFIHVASTSVKLSFPDAQIEVGNGSTQISIEPSFPFQTRPLKETPMLLPPMPRTWYLQPLGVVCVFTRCSRLHWAEDDTRPLVIETYSHEGPKEKYTHKYDSSRLHHLFREQQGAMQAHLPTRQSYLFNSYFYIKIVCIWNQASSSSYICINLSISTSTLISTLSFSFISSLKFS